MRVEMDLTDEMFAKIGDLADHRGETFAETFTYMINAGLFVAETMADGRAVFVQRGRETGLAPLSGWVN